VPVTVVALAVVVTSHALWPAHPLSAGASPLRTPIARTLPRSPVSAPAQAEFAVASTDDAVDATPGDGYCATDLGVCTLRAAVQEATALHRPMTIRMPPGTYALTLAGADEDASATGDLDLSGEIAIVGDAGREATVVESAVADRVFHVTAPATVTLRGLTVRNGSRVLAGGGILNEGGTLTVEDSEVSGNKTEPMTYPGTGVPRHGGGICNIDGTLTVRRTVVRANAADDGGGIGNDGNGPANVLVVDSDIRDNQAHDGAGIGIHGHDRIGLRVVRSVIVGNQADSLGGGIEMFTSGGGNAVAIAASEVRGNDAGDSGGGVWIGTFGQTAFHMVGSTVAENDAFSGGGINLGSQGVISATIADSAVIDNATVRNSGGGVRLDAAPCLTLTVSSALIARNRAAEGAGLKAASQERLAIRVINSTISSNVAAVRGGGVRLDNGEPFRGLNGILNLALDHATLAGNQAPLGRGIDAGHASVGGGQVLVKNSVMGGNGGLDDCLVTAPFKIASLGYNVARLGSCGLNAAHDLSGVDPLLGALLDTGGPTLTHALLAGSPAIDWADSLDCPATDQRGAPRPAGAGCDAGAFEFGAQPPPGPVNWDDVALPYAPVVPVTPSGDANHCAWPGPTPVLPPTLVPTPTATATAVPTPTATPPPPPTASANCVCPVVRKHVPPVVIADALANPGRYYGWRYLLNPGKPPGPDNPRRECLSLRSVGQPYHPLWNTPLWRVGWQ
jgi:large repetitive protein